MKTLYLLIICLSFSLMLRAQVTRTIEVTSGNFSSLLTAEERRTITHLTLTGTMDPNDFRCLSQMLSLTEVDLSGVTITPFYTVIMRYDMYYPANVFGCNEDNYIYYSFKNMPNLTSIVLPSTATKVESSVFEGCTKLKEVVLPPSLIYLMYYVFKDCISLTSIKIPPSVTSIGYGTFSGCISLISVELPEGITALGGTFANCTSLRTIELPASVKEIGSDTFLGCVSLTHIQIPPMVFEVSERAFKGCSSLSTITIPTAVKNIRTEVFAGCGGLPSISIPSQVTTIGNGAFDGCSSLKNIYAYPVQPPQYDVQDYQTAFTNVDKLNCVLYVPAGSKELYAQAKDWKDFKHILEMEVMKLSVNYLTLEAGSGTTSTQVTSGVPWTATSDQPWLTITPVSGTGNTTVTITLAANPAAFQRTAVITFTASTQSAQIITVFQQENTDPIELIAGQLSSKFTPSELKNISQLTIKGTMDARDFKTIRNNMDILTKLDISEATIVAYSGKEGTHYSEFDKIRNIFIDSFEYPANELPYKAFDGYCHQITTVNLPSSITSIGESAFANRRLLTEQIIPSTINNIGSFAFQGCENLKTIVLPPSVNTIGSNAFEGCSHLKTITLPPLLTQIKESLFERSGLSSINIPSRVNYISQVAFGYCDSLTSIYSYAPNPPELTWLYGDAQVFFNLDKSKCILYVPYGSKALYAAAHTDWKGFTNIIEMPGFRLSAATIAMKATQGDTASVSIKADVSWTATSDQSWLTIQPVSGTGKGMLLFTAQANTTEAGRMATVTVSAPYVVSQSIMVIQQGMPDSVNITPGSLAYAFNDAKLSGITQLTITGIMDARDFRIIRDKMPLLTHLDLSGVTINEYKGTDPYTNKVTTYRSQSIPQMAFFDPEKWKGKASLTSVILPLQLEKIGDWAFCNATGLTDISIPSTVRFINYSSFNYCPYLKTIISYMQTPPGSYDYGISFYNVDKTTCILTVPFGSKALYAEAPLWKDFKNIVEIAEFKIMTTEATLKATQDVARMRIQSQVPWTAEPSETWLSVTPASGKDEQVIIITAEANPLEMLRTGTVIFSAAGYLSQVFTIIQEGLLKTIHLTSGNLALLLTPQGMEQTTSLVLTGTMDARDFKVIRDKMPWLRYLDITGVTIIAYSGNDGTTYGDYSYKANAIPPNALYADYDSNKSRLSTVLLPSSLTLIDVWAFNASGALTSILIPSSVFAINEFAFYNCKALETVHMAEGVGSIAQNAFDACFSLTSVSIPSTIKYIGNAAFSNDNNLRSIYSYATVPVDLSNSVSVFWQIDKDTCILYVPYGSKALYEKADQWKDFQHIVEMAEFKVSKTTTNVEAKQGSKATVEITSDVTWTASCDQAWLTVNPATGTGSKTVAFIADANPSQATRTATVTLNAKGVDAKTIVVTQQTMPTGVNETEQDIAQFKCYPNPFTQEIAIEITNPKHEKVTVDIYNMAGQLIKNLLIGSVNEQVNLSWNGTNEGGLKVPPGVYICRVNNKSMQLIFEGQIGNK